jgi:hypothetical protein
MMFLSEHEGPEQSGGHFVLTDICLAQRVIKMTRTDLVKSVRNGGLLAQNGD